MNRPLPGLFLFVIAVVGALGCSRPTPAVVVPPSGFATDPDVVALIERLVKAAETSPRSAAAHRSLGLAFAANGSWELAEPCFQNALVLDPNDLEALFQSAIAAGERGDLSLRMERLKALLESKPDFYPAVYQLGVEHLERGDLAEAEAQFGALRAGFQKGPHGLLGLGEVALARNAYGDAIRWLEEAHRSAKEDGYIRFLLGQAYLGDGQEEQATPFLALGGDMGRPRLNSVSSVEMRKYQVGRADRLNQAVQLLKAGDHAGAVPLLEDLRRKDPQDTTCLSNLAVAYLYSGKADLGLKVLDEAIPLQPDQYELRLNRGACLFELYEQKRRDNQPQAAKELLAQAQESVQAGLVLFPKSQQGQTLLGRIRLAQNDPTDAMAALLKAIDLGGTDESHYVLLARAVLITQGPAEALQWVDEGLQKPGSRMELRFHQCGLLLQTEQGPLAREKQRAMAALEANNVWTLRADEMLRKAGL